MTSHAALLRKAYPFKSPSTTIDHLVIGGGVVGLSVAASLVNRAGSSKTTFLVERRGQLGQETTARNSEVIHSGIYYPIGSSKSQLCIKGRDMLYERCKRLDIGHKRTGKLIVATSERQVPYLRKLQSHSTHSSFLSNPDDPSSSSIPTRFISGDEARSLEPDLSSDVVGALHIPITGIVDSQGLVDSLAREIEEVDYNPQQGHGKKGEGVIVPGTRVVRIDKEDNGWVVQLETGWEGLKEGEKGDVESVRTEVLVNAAGLGSVSLLEEVVPDAELPKLWPVKGNYMSYKGPGVGKVKHLIYPCPGESIDHLGTHLTLDLDGHIKFGPDVQTIGDGSSSSQNPDFWLSHLSPASSPSLIEAFAKSVQTYLPNIDPSSLQPDYAGIRPNISPPNSGFSDFMIRHNVHERKGLIELLGFNSPGLTSSLAVGEYVAMMVNRDVWGKGKRKLEELATGWEK